MSENGKLYESILSQAKEKDTDGQLSCYDLLYGYIKVMSLKEPVRKSLFDSPEDQKELERINLLLDETGMNRDLAKAALPLMQNSKVLPRADAPPISGKSPSQILKEVLDRKLPEIEMLKGDATLDQVLAYIEKNRPAENAVRGTDSAEIPQQPPAKAAEAAAPLNKETPSEQNAPASEQYSFSQLIDKIKEMNIVLQERVLGQEEAIRIFLEGYFQSEFLKGAGDELHIPVFLYAGPPGVGKTMLALEAAKLLDRPYHKFDMAEYVDPNAEHLFRGVPKTYQAPKEGEVTGFVKEHPNAVLIFDEIEKANINVIHLFLQILDGGQINDAFTDETVSFKDTMMIFTTNVGKELYEGEWTENLSALPTRVIINALEKETDQYGQNLFPASLCSRFATGNVVMFNHLNISHLIRIAENGFDGCKRAMKTVYGYDLTYDPKLPTLFLYSLGSEMDARTVTGRSGRMINQEIYELGWHMPDPEQLNNLKSVRIEVDLDNASEEIRSLMVSDELPRVLLIAEQEAWKDIPINEGCLLDFAQSGEEAFALIEGNDYSMVLVDPFFRPDESGSRFLSLDDFRSEGIQILNAITEKSIWAPVYLLETKPIGMEDRQIFRQRGIRGFFAADDPVQLADGIMTLADSLYLQERAQDLSRRNRVVTYNTWQTVSDDGTEATISLYDFKINVAVDAGDREALLSDADRPKERFDDVIGAENAKAELRSFIEYLKHPKKYMVSGKVPPKGVLLYGPPGTGKTMLARAMAGESDVSFIQTSAGALANKYVGESERNIRELFRKARSYAPSIIFIDEIDAIGKERTGSEFTHHTEGMLNQLLAEMDGFKVDPSKPVFVLAATNFDLDGTKSNKRAVLDEALVRRFANRIYVDLPNKSEREQYLKMQLEGREHSVSPAAIANVASRTTGQSLAILKGIIELAWRNADKGDAGLDDDCLLNSLEEYMFGEKKEWNEEYYRSVAIHESGHAWVGWRSGDKPDYITVVSRGNFGGYVQTSNEDTPSYSREQLLWKIRTCLAGRAAEICWLGEEKGTNTGVSSDLRQATSYAINMICQYGMGDSSLVSLDPDMIMRTPNGEALLKEADRILREEMENTKRLVEEGREKIDKLVDVLMNDNQAIGEEIDRIFSAK